MAIPFTKVEAIGNHFVLIDARDLPEMDWPKLALRMCEHHFGVGADGLLVISTSDRADFRLRMWNPDGTEDVCGNGMRIAAVYAHEHALAEGASLTMEAKSGIVHAEVAVDDTGALSARVNMGTPSTRPYDIPLAPGSGDPLNLPIEIDGRCYTASCVMVGTPHAVIFADAGVFWETVPADSPRIETHRMFPERISVTWCHVDAADSLVIRTWERGVGPTLGCGSGACAALAAANLRGLVGTSASVRSPGGTLHIDWPDRGDIFASGPTRRVFEGVWPG